MMPRAARPARSCFAPPVPGAPSPFGNGFSQTGLDWIVLDVCDRSLKVTFVTDVSVEVILVPERAIALQEAIGLLRREGFPRLNDLSKAMLVQRHDHRMNMVGHD